MSDVARNPILTVIVIPDRLDGRHSNQLIKRTSKLKETPSAPRIEWIAPDVIRMASLVPPAAKSSCGGNVDDIAANDNDDGGPETPGDGANGDEDERNERGGSDTRSADNSKLILSIEDKLRFLFDCPIKRLKRPASFPK